MRDAVPEPRLARPATARGLKEEARGAANGEKRDGETARILFAIKARDNLKAITITHGFRVYAASWLTALRPARPPLRSRIHIRVSARFLRGRADRFA